MTSGAGFSIRILTGAQAREHLDGLAEILADCVNGGAGVGFMLPFDPAGARAWWEGILPGVENGERILFVAFDGERPVGTVQLCPAGMPNQSHRADIAKMLVNSTARRRGVGEALMRAAEEQARAIGRNVLTLDTVSDSAARRLYERLGWQVTGTVPRYAYAPDGGWHDSTFMWKAL